MVLFHDVVEVFPPDHLDWDRAPKAFQHFVDCVDSSGVRTAFVDGDLSWMTIAFQHSSKELCGSRFIPTMLKHEIERFAVFIDGSAEVHPGAYYLEIGLVHPP